VWLPHASLSRTTPEETAGTPLALASSLVRELKGHALEASSSVGSPAHLRLVIAHGAVTLDLVEAIRGRLRERILAWALRPAGLHRIESMIEIAL
jgi:hypothetical protein